MEGNGSHEDDNTKEDTGNKEKGQLIPIPAALQHNDFLFPGVPASPPRFISVEQVMEASDTFSKLALAHEIAVNNEFTLEKSEAKTSIEKQVKEVVHKAFWDILQQQLSETPPNYSQALTLFHEIKEMLKELLVMPHQTRARSYIDEVLDLDLIKQQAENEVLDFKHYANQIISTMSRLCAPLRDEQIQELSNITEIIPLYKGILDILELMKLDMANFAIKQIRPQIQQHSIEYEKQKFKDFLNSLKGVDGLLLTRKWLSRVYEANLCADQSSAVAKSELSDQEILSRAYLELLQWKEELFPETLQMDRIRFLCLRNQFFEILLSASIALVTYSIVGEAIQGITSFKEQLKDHLFILLKDSSTCSKDELDQKLQGVSLQVVKEVNECLQKHGYSLLDDNKADILKSQIEEIGLEDHSVKKLICTRVLEFAKQILDSPDAASVKFPIGLSAFHKELSSLVGQFLRLVKYNQAVFSEFYVDILSNVRQQRVSSCTE